MLTILGIDEAGRGPVIGPMVIAGVSIQEKNIHLLKKLGVRDSKLLTKKHREKLFNEILSIVDKHLAIIISPKEIDKYLLSTDINLNKLEALKTATIINKLKPDIVIIDCPSNNIEAYKEYLSSFIECNVKLIVEHKADTKYEIVSAASIIAKVIRDNEIYKIQSRINEPIGSGYPSDPITISFLEKHYNDYPEIFRHSWESWRRINNKTINKQNKISDY